MNWRNLRRIGRVAHPQRDRRRPAATAPTAPRTAAATARVAAARPPGARAGSAACRRALTTSGSSVRSTVVKPAISGGTNACWFELDSGSGASRTMLTTAPAAPAEDRGHGQDRRDRGGRADAPTVGDDRHRRSPRSRRRRSRTGSSATAGATRWRTSSSPRSIGKLSVRSGWSISCDSGSIASRPSTNSSTAEPTTAGVVPRNTATWHPPATAASAHHAHDARRSGSGARLCQPRRHTASPAVATAAP